MHFEIPKKVKTIWDEWNIRGAVLASLFIQILLIFIATWRKRTKRGTVTSLIWGAYLLADWIAAFAVGLIFSAQGNVTDNKQLLNEGLAAFWAPFLLLHLGGPDTITAFSLEDNELWLRHLLALLFQVAAVSYVFLKSLPNEFWIPTVLVFFAGTIKYAERTRALCLGCLSNFKASMIPEPEAGINYPQLMEEYALNMEAQVPVKVVVGKEVKKGSRPLAEEDLMIKSIKDEIEVVQNAYGFFKILKGLIVDLAFSLQERQESRSFFLQRDFRDAFRVMEVELNFLYDVLYSKMAVVHSGIGFIFRFVCSVLIVVSLALFASHHKHQLHPLDIAVTYTLLIGALGLDLVALVKLIFSDWTVVNLEECSLKRIVYAIRKRLSFDQTRRWSKSISQHSLISYCLEERINWFDKAPVFFGLKDFLDEMRYIRTKPVENELMQFIFEQLREKAREAKDPKIAKEMCSARGDWILTQYLSFVSPIVATVGEEVEYDESLLLWHVATDLCYFTNHKSEGDGQSREFCRTLSDYMLYLIVMQPTIMSAVAGTSQIRFRDTSAEAKKFFRGKESNSKPPTMFKNFKKFFRGRRQLEEESKKKQEKACEELLAVNVAVKPIELKGEKSKSLLFDACILAKDLMKLKNERRMWEIMSKVWVELLCYAASHCKATAYAQHLSKGGELITFVWLLMAHFGLREHFRKDDIPVFKLIVSK